MISISSSTQPNINIVQLIQLEKIQISQISTLQDKINSMKDQLKNLSLSATKIIQKKLSNTNTTKPQSLIHFAYDSKKLQQIKDNKQKIYREIAQTKNLIQSLKLQQEPQVKTEILKRQIKLKQITQEIKKASQQKKYVVQQLQTNKGKIHQIKQSTYNKDLLQNHKILEEGKKQKSTLQKKMNNFINLEIQANLFFYQIKQKLQKSNQQTIQTKERNQVSTQEINNLIEQINEIIMRRNEVEKQKSCQILQLKNQIKQMQIQKDNLKIAFREQESKIMKKNLDDRFYQSRMERVSKSTNSIIKNRQYNSVYVRKSDQVQTSKSKVSFINKKLKTKNSQNLILIGSNQMNQTCKILRDSVYENVQKINSLVFILSDNKIVGVKSSYIGRQGNKIIGQVLSIDKLDKVVEKQILVKQIKQIQYPLNSKQLFIKIIKFNGSVQNIGTQYYGATIKSNISLKTIKNVDIIVQKNKQGIYNKVKGININLQSRVQIQRLQNDEVKQQRQGDEVSYETYLTSSPQNLVRKTQSIDNVSRYKKKLVLKPIKKQIEGNLDHRLLIRKKLV